MRTRKRHVGKDKGTSSGLKSDVTLKGPLHRYGVRVG